VQVLSQAVLLLVLVQDMVQGETVYKSDKGHAVFEWYQSSEQPDELSKMYRIFFADGRQLWTNTMDIIKKQLEHKKPKSEVVQLSMF